MKKIVVILILTLLVLTACQSKTSTKTTIVPSGDTDVDEIAQGINEIDDLDIDSDLAELDELEKDLALI